jgi:hypothetical protein
MGTDTVSAGYGIIRDAVVADHEVNSNVTSSHPMITIFEAF